MSEKRSPRPAIPKRLASRVRAAQLKVIDARQDILHAEKRIVQDEERLAEFRDAPEAFAARYYGRNGVDSYPVRTTIERTDAALSRRADRRPLRVTRLAKAEAHLAKVEDEVLREVSGMKPTSGRVPWPRRLKNFELFKSEWESEFERLRLKDLADYDRQRAADERYDREEDARLQVERDRDDQQFLEENRRHLASLSPEARRKEEETTRRIRDALKSGEITVADILGKLRGA